jgi:hypothetical protein
MTATEFLTSLNGRGVHLWQDGDGNLRLRAPRGVVTTAVAAKIEQAKPQLLPLLARSSPPLTDQEIADFRQMWEWASPSE